MPRLTLRTLLAYIDDTLDPAETRSLGKKVAASAEARQLVERIKKVTRRRGLATPDEHGHEEAGDPNTVAEYLDNSLDSATLKQVEETCLESDVHLAEVAACHQILTLVLTEPVRVPPRAHRRMYALVPPPASVPNRRPNKTLPIGGAAPPSAEQVEVDDADAALLLGMKRYSAATTWAARFALFGAAAVLLILLTGAALLSLSHQSPKPPESTAGHSSALQTPAVQVAPMPAEAKPKDKGPDTAAPPPSGKPPEPPEPPPPPMPDPRVVNPADIVPAPPVHGLGELANPPSDKRVAIGKVETNRALVVSYVPDLIDQPDGARSWVRLHVKPEDDRPVFSNDPVMALPGYKANVLLGERGKQVDVHLWGNVPEQLPYRVFESRVKFHVPPEGFDADLTLVAGRIYLKSKKLDADRKPTSAKVRVRLGEEVWDITLLNEKTDVLVELISWFEPGTPYAPKDGARPKLEGRATVVSGVAALSAPNRPKKFDKLAEGMQVAWDTSTGSLSDPRPCDMQESVRVPALDGKLQILVSGILTATADLVTEPTTVVRTVLKGRLDPPAAVMANRDLISRLAVYSMAALAECSADGEPLLGDVVDVLRSELPWEARQAVVTALVNWVARDRDNTAILRRVIVQKVGGDQKDAEVTADWLLRLLRGYITPFVSSAKPEAGLLAQLVEQRGDNLPSLLEDKDIAVREAALWNLLAVEQATWIPRPILVNVGAVGTKVNTPEYQKFVAFWRKQVEAIKTRPPKK